MSDHTRALVPLEAWSFNSPDCKASGLDLDLGLLAEALIYYETVLVNVSNPPQFVELLRWFIKQGKISDFLAMVEDGTIIVFDFSFQSQALLGDGLYSVMNIQDEIQAQPNSFERRFLYGKDLEEALPRSRDRQRLYRALRGRVVEVKADDFGAAIENARADYRDARRIELIVQSFVDDLYAMKGLGRPPDLHARVEMSPDGKQQHIHWDSDFREIETHAGKILNYHPGQPLTACAHSNRLIWAAAGSNCDLYLGSPMSKLVGDKLYESVDAPTRTGKIITDLKDEVEFPDVRLLVNQGNLNLGDVLSLRSKAGRFHRWLQEESGRDRNAIIAYHQEVAREAGYVRHARRALRLFGVVGGLAAAVPIGERFGPFAGGMTGAAVPYLANLAAKIGAGWKPVVFGDWMRNRIEHLLKDRQ